MEKTKLTDNARTRLRELITSPEGREILWFLERLSPLAIVDTDSSNPVEVAALTGAQSKGWKKCMRALEDMSDPDYQVNKVK